MRTLTVDEVEEVNGAWVAAAIGAAAVIIAAIITSCSDDDGVEASAPNGAKVKCPNGTTATATATSATCK